jgi:hypothetical protein
MNIEAPNRNTRRTFVYLTWTISVFLAVALAWLGPATEAVSTVTEWLMIYSITVAGGYLGFGTIDYINAVKEKNDGAEHTNG